MKSHLVDRKSTPQEKLVYVKTTNNLFIPAVSMSSMRVCDDFTKNSIDEIITDVFKRNGCLSIQ